MRRRRRRTRRGAREEEKGEYERERVAQENAWKCIPRSEGVPVAKPKDREKRARPRVEGGGPEDTIGIVTGTRRIL